MGHHPSADIAYGVGFYSGGEGFLTKEHDEDYEFKGPWQSGEYGDDDTDEVEALLLRFLLRSLPQDPYGDEVNDEDAYTLNKWLKERTGLHLVNFGHEGGCSFLAAGPELTVYAYDIVDISNLNGPSDEERNWMAWAVEKMDVTFTSGKPKMSVMVSYG